MKHTYPHHFASSLLVAAALAGACAPAVTTTTAGVSTPAAVGANPFFVESPLPYHAPRFDLIRNEHYQAALEEGMRQQLAEIVAFARQTVPPMFDNTVEATEHAVAVLQRLSNTSC